KTASHLSLLEHEFRTDPASRQMPNCVSHPPSPPSGKKRVSSPWRAGTRIFQSSSLPHKQGKDHGNPFGKRLSWAWPGSLALSRHQPVRFPLRKRNRPQAHPREVRLLPRGQWSKRADKRGRTPARSEWPPNPGSGHNKPPSAFLVAHEYRFLTPLVQQLHRPSKEQPAGNQFRGSRVSRERTSWRPQWGEVLTLLL